MHDTYEWKWQKKQQQQRIQLLSPSNTAENCPERNESEGGGSTTTHTTTTELSRLEGNKTHKKQVTVRYPEQKGLILIGFSFF